MKTMGIACVAALALPSCMGFYGNRSTYGQAGGGAEIGGARVSMQVRPEGTSGGSYALSAMVVGVGVANLDGPFSWRIEAVGREGVHERMYVQGIRTVTSITGRNEKFPEQWLGERRDFVRKKSYAPGEVRAVFEVPAKLDVKPSVDGALDVFADIIVVAEGSQTRRNVKFRLDPASKKDREVIFIPAEIVTGIGKPMSEWEEKGWD
ncbi:hypothetical protein HZ994_08115 [Akkermansiaceae bacterium]|nr:hypothetical protein HZ994_08115 [Akkermansiaceae bacterium]